MIDEIDSGDIKGLEDTTVQTDVEKAAFNKVNKYQRSDNYTGRGQRLLKQSDEVARQFNQANYQFYAEDKAKDAEKEQESQNQDDQKQAMLKKSTMVKLNSTKQDEVNHDELLKYEVPKTTRVNESKKENYYFDFDQDENELIINKNLNQDLKKVDMLVDNPDKFKKFQASYSTDPELRKIYEAEQEEIDQNFETQSTNLLKATTLKHSETMSTINDEQVIKNVAFYIAGQPKALKPILCETETNVQHLEGPSNNVFKNQQSILKDSKVFTTENQFNMTKSTTLRHMSTTLSDKFASFTPAHQDCAKSSHSFRLTTSRSFRKKNANALGLKLGHPRLVGLKNSRMLKQKEYGNSLSEVNRICIQKQLDQEKEEGYYEKFNDAYKSIAKNH